MKQIKANHYTEMLIFRINHLIGEIMFDLKQYVNSLNLNITAEQFAVLDTIYSHKDICQQDVAEILNKDKSNVKRIVEILENKGYIYRTTGKKNNRLVNYLNITDDGAKLADENIKKIKNYLQTYFNYVSDEDITTMETILKQIRNGKCRN